MIAAFRHECVYGEACHSGHHFDCRLEFLQRNDIKHQYVGDAYFPKVNGVYPRFVPYLRRRRLFIWSDSTWGVAILTKPTKQCRFVFLLLAALGA
jgi:hypothetical protein